MGVKVVPIKMIIGPAECAICGKEGDVWCYGKVVAETEKGIYWNGVVCDSCAWKIIHDNKRKRLLGYKNAIDKDIARLESRIIARIEPQMNEEFLSKLGDEVLDGMAHVEYGIHTSVNNPNNKSYDKHPY